MCYCTPHKRTPYCENCPWQMQKDIGDFREKYNKLVDFVKKASKSSCCLLCECLSCEAVKLLRGFGESDE